jgi:hypothetical protein
MIAAHTSSSPMSLYFEWMAVIFWGLVFIRVGFSRKPLPGPFKIPGKIIRFILVIVTFGLLAGCSNPDPLAVASGPVFQLNSGHWQPSPQDLAGPPAVTNP